MKPFSLHIALFFLFSLSFANRAYNQRSSYCNNCLMHFGTQVDHKGVVQNKNYQFNLSNDSSITIHVNLFDSYQKKLGFSKAHVLITKKDSNLNDIDKLYDEIIDDIPAERWGFSFNFIVNSPGIYSVTVNDEDDRYMNSGYIIVK